MEQERRRRELEGLRDRVSVLEAEIRASNPQSTNWPPRQFYWLNYAIAGFALGGIGAMTSLLFNVAVSFYEGQHPLHIIQVNLTFGLGDTALTLNNNLTLVIGCLFYLLFGMLKRLQQKFFFGDGEDAIINFAFEGITTRTLRSRN